MWESNIIDVGHLRLDNMDRAGNTRNVFLCPECLEVYEAHQKQDDLLVPVDKFFKRNYQYSIKNLQFVEDVYGNCPVLRFEYGTVGWIEAKKEVKK